MPKKNHLKITDVNVATAVIAHEAVTCFCATEEKESAQPKKLTSCTGGVFWGTKGETWPVSADGKPLIPWLQIVCTEVGQLSGAFHKLAVVCFFIRPDFSDWQAVSVSDESDFVVREYKRAKDLIPLSRPRVLKGHPFHRVTWEEMDDYPSLSKYHDLFDKPVYDALCEIEKFQFANRSGIKIGGWSTPIQGNQRYPGHCELQIDVTRNYMYGDTGIGYLWRSDGQWNVYFECC